MCLHPPALILQWINTDRWQYFEKWHTDPLIQCNIRYVWHEITDSSADSRTRPHKHTHTQESYLWLWYVRSEQEPLWTVLPGSRANDWGPFALQIRLESENRRHPTNSPCDVGTCVFWPGLEYTGVGFTERGEWKRARHYSQKRRWKWYELWLEPAK